MIQRSLWLCFLALPAACGANAGKLSCPCIKTEKGVLSSFQGTLDGETCAILTWRNGSQYCYPKDYGQGECKTWDESLPPECSGVYVPDWCTDTWCYVDSDACTGVDDLASSAWFKPADGAAPQYSYGTCGDESYFARYQASVDKPATELIDVVEGYSRNIRKEVEDAYALLSDEESNKKCVNWNSGCPCSSCVVSPEWTKQVQPGSSSYGDDIKLNHKRSVVVLKNQVKDLKTPDVQTFQCMSEIVQSRFKSIVRNEYNDRNRVAYMYYGDQKTGGILNWPAMEWCTDSYDSRFRPWYAQAASGPKDVILVIDTSGSMSSLGLMQPAREAAKIVLGTLTENDYATIVTYSSRVKVFDDSDVLVPVTEKNREHLQSWIDAEAAVGGTDFMLGFSKAAEIFEASTEAGKTSGCLKSVLFLTDGNDERDFKPSDIKKLPGLTDVTILTYSFGPDADAKLPKQIACQNRGIWYHVTDTSQIGNVMAQYYSLFAAGIDSDKVRWSQYTDSVTGQELIAGCLPAYDRSRSFPELVGVSCMDISVIISNDDLREKPTFPAMLSKMKSITSACPKVDFGASTLQHLRQQVGPGSVCRSCDSTDEGCAGPAPVPVPAPGSPGSPSPSPSPAPGGDDTKVAGEADSTCSASLLPILLSSLTWTFSSVSW